MQVECCDRVFIKYSQICPFCITLYKNRQLVLWSAACIGTVQRVAAGSIRARPPAPRTPLGDALRGDVTL